MKLSSLFALLFAAGALSNLLRAEPDLDNALLGACIALGLFLFRLFVTDSEDERSDDFFAWIEENRRELRTGRAVYRGVPITPATQVRTFLLVVSFGFFTTKSARGVYVHGVHARFLPATFYTLLTLTLGWWGIPWGPIYTFEALAANLAGGRSMTVAELMHAAPHVPRAASPRTGLVTA